jgi:hypothetical protein
MLRCMDKVIWGTEGDSMRYLDMVSLDLEGNGLRDAYLLN